MFELGKLFVSMQARDQGLNKTLDGAHKRARNAKGQFISMGQGITGAMGRSSRSVGGLSGMLGGLGKAGPPALMAVQVAAAAVTKGLNIVFSVIKAGIRWMSRLSIAAAILAAMTIRVAAGAEEVDSKFQVVFGQAAPKAEAALKSFSDQANRSVLDLKDMASGVQDILVPFGFAREAAAGLSIDITKLATDLASFNNLADDEAMDSIVAALTGSHETVKKFGVIINEVTLKQELMNMGFKGAVKDASEQAKVMARLNIIMKGTSDAQGDAIRTSGSFTNQMKGLKSTVKDVAKIIGDALLPAATMLVKWFREKIAVLKESSDTFQRWGEIATKWMTKIIRFAERMMTVFRDWEMVKEFLPLAFNVAFSAMLQLMEKAFGKMVELAFVALKKIARASADAALEIVTLGTANTKTFNETFKNADHLNGALKDMERFWRKIDKQIKASGKSVKEVRDEVDEFQKPNVKLGAAKDKVEKKLKVDIVSQSSLFSRTLKEAFKDEKGKEQVEVMKKQVQVAVAAKDEANKNARKLEVVIIKLNPAVGA